MNPFESLQARFSLRWSRRLVLASAITALPTLSSGTVAIADDRDDGAVRIMTQNLYQGTNFTEVLSATTPAAFVGAVTTTFNNILNTKPLERAAAVAGEIARERPDLVGLQEAAIVRTGTAPATTVVVDQLQALLGELDKRGQRYEAVAIVPNVDVEAPSTLGFDVRVTVRTVIIARAGSNDLKLSNLQVQSFLVNKSFGTAVGSVINTRGWASVDVRLRGRSFRLATTHLEGASPFTIQQAQAKELIQSAGNTTLPVVFIGDFNIAANNGLDPTFPTYQLFINAGFTEAWPLKHAPDPGFTCCQNPDLLNPTSLLNTRIDLVLFRGAFAVTDIKRVGDSPSDRTPSGLWPSDHAGVVATLQVPATND